VCVPQMTLFSAAVASTARLTLAQKVGLDSSSDALQRAAGRWGNKATIFAIAAKRTDLRSYFVPIGALLSSHLDTLQWLVEELHYALPAASWVLQIAAFGGCTNMLAYLKQRGMTLTADLLKHAAVSGHWHAVQYMHDEGLVWDSNVCDAAARYGHPALLQQLREHGCPWDTSEIGVQAACSGNVQLLQWLKEQGIVFPKTTMAGAVSGGHIAACEYLRFTEQCPWSSNLCMYAADFNARRRIS
jgi:hypothetical protein